MAERVYAVTGDAPCPVNQTLFQGFEWYIPADQQHWARLNHALPGLAALGVTGMWIPPAAKAMSPDSNGYDAYDLYDLGEFDQKGSRHTKWGSKEELVRLAARARSCGIGLLFDAILNHKAGADHSEDAMAVEVDPEDRLEEISKLHMIEAWTRFEFAGRGNRYSEMKWNKNHFTGVDWDQKSSSVGVFRFHGKKWAPDVDNEFGNYDFLLCTNIDHSHPEVRREFFHWITWLSSELELDGLRLDAIKHISASFLRDFLIHVDKTVSKKWLILGDYWRADTKVLAGYIDYMDGRLSLFDVPLVEGFSKVSLGNEPDMRRIFDDALAAVKPDNSLTFVTTHDTQTGQTLETSVEPFFVPIAYAIILLRANFGLPCIFWAHLYGTLYPQCPQGPPNGGLVVPRLMQARRLWAYGTEVTYCSDSPTCVGFTRHGHPLQSRGAGLAVVANTGWRHDRKRMCVGRRHVGERWTDVLEQAWGEVVIDESGYGMFPVGPRGVAVWVSEDADGRDLIQSFMFDHGNYGIVQEAHVEDGYSGYSLAKEDLPKDPTNNPPPWLQSTLDKRQ